MKAFVVTLTLTLAAAPQALAVFTRQPYLQNLNDTSVVVRWESSTSQTGLVQYGLSAAYGLQAADPSPGASHELTLPGLLHDTIYHYRAIAGGETSADADFYTTGAWGRPFRFIAYGDNRSDSSAHQGVIDQMALVKPAPRLLLNVGDLTYLGSSSQYRTFFNIERRLLRNVPMYPVLGNHDILNTGNWFSSFVLPNNERWFTVRYGNSAFHCLDNHSSYSPGSAQYNWLLSELQADRANPRIRHIFVQLHEPPYTTNLAHAGSPGVREHLCPLFERFQVRIVFSGHNHCYERSSVNGVQYIITGAGGAPRSDNWAPAQPETQYREATNEFVLVDVRGDTISCRGVRSTGTVFDSFDVIARPASEPARTEPIPKARLVSVARNPGLNRVSIRFSLAGPGYVRLVIHDSNGRVLATLQDGVLPAGLHKAVWNAAAAPTGRYFCRLQTDANTISREIRMTKSE